MTLLRHSARLAALVLGGALAMSCDTRLPTQPPLPTGPATDVTPPTLSFALTGGTNNTVDLDKAVSVVVTSTDNVGVQALNTTINLSAAILKADTSVYVPTVASAVRTIPVPLSGLKAGDKITIRASAGDASTNFKTDSIIVTVNDTTTPKVTLYSSKSGRLTKGGDTLDVTVAATDSAGIQYVGYRLLRLRSATDTVVVRAESTFVPASTNPTNFAPAPYAWILPDTLLTGSYTVVGFAKDGSGLTTRPGPTLQFTVVDGKKPTLTFIVPQPTAKLNIGDSLLVTARIQDNIALSTVSFRGITARGDAALGTADTVQRYSPVTAPQTGVFVAGLRDTTISRYLKVVQPVDSTADSVTVLAYTRDASGNADTSRVTIQLVTGPRVTFLAPVKGDSATAAAGLTVTLNATHPNGVAKLGFRMQGASSWVNPLDTTIVWNYGAPPKDVTVSATIQIPANAPAGSVITITPISQDASGQAGSSTPFLIAVRNGAAPPPRVYQTVPPRYELTDSVSVTAVGNGITYVGFELRDAANTIVKRDSLAQTSPYPSTAVVGVPLNLPTSAQGKTLAVVTFAYDQGGRVGYSLPANVTVPQQSAALAKVDSALIVYGHTYPLPAARSGIIADVVVDPARGNVFASNITANRIEVWQQAAKSFDATGIFVGSQPWGMTLSRTATAGDTMYVANSGGTNLSRVYIGAATPSGMKEDLNNRILTRISLLYKVSEQRDQATGKIRLTLTGPILFSDRPQYVQQSTAGRIYLSTRPTQAASSGTVRYLDPKAVAPDQRFILAFARAGGDANSYLIANIDAASVTPAPANSIASDVLTLCDHPSGTTADPICASSALGIAAAVDSLRATVPTSDVDAQVNLDEASLGLTDTTYAAASADGQWIAFGEGHKAPYARVFLLRDDGTVPDRYTYASPSLNVADLVNNASDQLYGLALDKFGKSLAVHGNDSYFASVTQPFTQRLQGTASTFDVGAGITFHPNADGNNTPADSRLAFVASNNGQVDLVDVAYFTSRGTLTTKLNLTGPLRASLPFPGDDPSIVLKLFGVSSKGLVVIDVTAADIKPGP
jgi:hypothetical protein